MRDPNPGAYSNCSPLPPNNLICSTAAGLLTSCYVLNYFTYTYNYTIDTLGQVQNSEQAEILDNGSITEIVNISQPSSVTKTQSFAAWGMFIDQSPICNGSTLVNGTLTGPVFTNGSWNFNTGSYIFTDPVGQKGTQAGANFSGGCNPANTLPSTSSGQTVNPTFGNGFTMNMAAVTPPPNSFSQNVGCGGWKKAPEKRIPSPTPGDMNSASMQTAAGSIWPKTGSGQPSQPTSGVYMPYVPVGSDANRICHCLAGDMPAGSHLRVA